MSRFWEIPSDRLWRSVVKRFVKTRRRRRTLTLPSSAVLAEVKMKRMDFCDILLTYTILGWY